MKRIIFLLLFAFLAIQVSAQTEFKKGIKVDGKTLSNAELGALDSIKTDQPIQRQLDKTVKTSDLVPATSDFYTKAQSNAIIDSVFNVSTGLLRSVQILGSTAKGMSLYQGLTSGVTTMVDGTVIVVPVKFNKAGSCSSIKVAIGTPGNYTGDNYNEACLLTSDGTTLNVVARSDNVANRWTASTGSLTITFSASYTVNTTSIYYVALLFNCSGTATTAPTLVNSSALHYAGLAALGIDYKLFGGTLAAQTTIPATITISTLTSNSAIPLVVGY